jgi:hypothetical protein
LCCTLLVSNTAYTVTHRQYQASIKSLRAEITAIEGEQSKLQARQQQQRRKSLVSTAKAPGSAVGASAAASGAASAEELRIKQQLKEKTRLLEEKMKLLKTKESEFTKVSTQKTKLAGEVDSMKKVVEENKRRRAELQRKMRDEAVLHRNEKVQIKHSEVQARRGELQAQQHAVRLEGQLNSKEKVWRAQLESKEREAKALKEVVQKQANVKSSNMVSKSGATNGSSGVSAHMLAAAGALMTQQGSSGLSTQDALNLKLWVDTELEAQVKRVTTQEALNREMLLRTKAAQALQAVRRSSHGNTNVDTSLNGTSLPADAKVLENELRQRSATIAGLNGVLSDLGQASTADRKRFARFTELKESRHVSELLFEVAYKSQKRAHSATKRAKALQDALTRCKAQLQEAQQQAAQVNRNERYIFDDEESERAEMDETFYPSEDDSAYVSDASDSDGSYPAGKRKGRGATWKTAGAKKRKAGSADSSVEVDAQTAADVGEEAAKVKKVRVQAPAKRGGGKRRAASNEGAAADSDAESAASSGGSDEGSSSDGSDSDGEEQRTTKRKKQSQAQKKDAAGAANKKPKRQAAVDPDFDDAEITFPLTKHSIPELKRFLAAKGLPVSGATTLITC